MMDILNNLLKKSFQENRSRLALTGLLPGSVNLNYSDLNKFSSVVSDILNNNSKPNDRTIVLTQRHPHGIAAIVGVFFSHTTYVPIDSQDPVERIRYILGDSEANQIIVDDETLKGISKLRELEPALFQNVKIYNLNELKKTFKNHKQTYKEVLKNNKTASYIIYTSGTTGRPKGVLVGEGTLIHLLNWINENTLAKRTSKTLLFYSLGFDPSLLEIFSTLINGKELVICDQKTKKDLSKFINGIKEQRVERLFIPISLVQMISEEFSIEDLPSLKEINCGGDRMVITPSIRSFFSNSNVHLNNQYGPTEATIMVTHENLKGTAEMWPTYPSIGVPVAKSKLFVLNEKLEVLPFGEKGILHIGGRLLAEGYWKRKELTEKSFFYHDELKQRVYRTGDVASIDEHGNLSFYGREDHQIKINGLRVECSEIENLIKQELLERNHKSDDVVVQLCDRNFENGQSQKFLGAAIKSLSAIDGTSLKKELSQKLPSGMVPTLFISLSDFPLTSNGKIDRKRIKEKLELSIQGEEIGFQERSTTNPLVDEMVFVLKEISGLAVNPHQSVFEQSLTSLQAIKFIHRINKKFKNLGKTFKVNIAELYKYPVLVELESKLNNREEKLGPKNLGKEEIQNSKREVAIVGMSCRFPGAESLEKFKEMIRNNNQGIEFFNKDELTHPSQDLIKDKENFISARGILKDIDLFDSDYFGIPPRVAEVMDPQLRIFLEESLNAIENTLYLDKENTGVFCGMSNNTYIDQVETLNSVKCENVGRWNLATLNEKDYIATQVAHKLNLKGPAISIHTACSTSLVAMIQAVRSIQNGECESALCGGVHVDSRHKTGHLYQEGAIFSKDGYCRPYDENASGTIFSDGVGIVVLKEYEQAKRDGNQILAIVTGCGLNNDGSDKTSFTAPSVKGQRDAIVKAMVEADISPDELSFIEGHGTATPVGDPIEVQGLMEAYDTFGGVKTKIGLSSVKSQIGHTVAASGIAGVIKSVICLQEGMISSIFNFKRPNPLLNIEETPFLLEKFISYQKNKAKKYCGISSFGVGGTNAHIILKKLDVSKPLKFEKEPSFKIKRFIFPFSAKSKKRLNAELLHNLKFLKNNDIEISSFAKALSSKECLPYRKAFVAKNKNELIKLIQESVDSLETFKKAKTLDKIIFGVPGQGAQYPALGKELYDEYPIFKKVVDSCCSFYQNELGIDLRNIIFGKDADLIHLTQYTQPALFIYQLGVMKLLESYGIKPDILIGHSVGEFAAATFNGLFNEEDAIRLIGKRGSLMASLPEGKMLSVRESKIVLEDYLTDFKKEDKGKNGYTLSLSTINSRKLCVLGGATGILKRFKFFLDSKGVISKELKTSHAFHTEMMNPILNNFSKELINKKLGSENYIQIPSSDQEILLNNPKYWVDHISKAVHFEKASIELSQFISKEKTNLIFDIGPRMVVGTLLKNNLPEYELEIQSVNSGETGSESLSLSNSIAKAWEKGLDVDFRKIYSSYDWIQLPIVYLEKKSYWAGYPLNKAKIKKVQEKNLDNEDLMKNFKKTLCNFIEEKSGFNNLEIDISFLELGLDSLLLTQLAIDLKNEFSVEISFRDLMDSIDTVDKLANIILKERPDLEKKITVSSAPVSCQKSEDNTSNLFNSVKDGMANQVSREHGNITKRKDHFVSTPSNNIGSMNSDLGQIIQSQMDLMKIQLELLRGGNGSYNFPSFSNEVPIKQYDEYQTVNEGKKISSLQDEVKIEESRNLKKESKDDRVKGTVNTSKIGFGAQARVNTIREKSELEVQNSVAEIIKKYCEKTPSSKQYTEKYRKVNADPRVVTGFRPEIKELTYPIVVNKSKNQRLWDIDGNEYIDVTCGFGSNFFGNQNKRINDALHDQIDKGFEIGPQHELAGECAELLCELTGNERSAFCNTGSEAVLGALRVARTITGRQKVVMFKGSYHGINDEVIVRGRGDGKSMPAAAGINPSATKDMILLNYGEEDALQFVRDNAEDLAAVIVEPVQSRRSNFHPKEFLKELRVITEKSGSAFIFDEVITGFRIAQGGAQEYFGIEADLVTYGKIIGGGMPIGVVSGKSKFMDALDGGSWQFGDNSVPTTAITYFAGTFVRHPLALRALREALLILKEGGKDLYYEINQKAQWFVDNLNNLSDAFGAPIVVDNFGGVLKPRFIDKGKNNDLFFALMRIEGIHCYDGFPWFVTLGHEEGDLEIVLKAWKKCIVEMQRLGLFPKGIVHETGSFVQGEKDLSFDRGTLLTTEKEKVESVVDSKQCFEEKV